MKRNYILKVTLILTSFMLTVGIGGSFIGKSNNYSKENQVVKATIVGENLDTNVDENKNVDETIKSEVKNINEEDTKEEKGSNLLEVEDLAKEESNKEIKEEKETEVKLEDLNVEDKSKQLINKSGYVRDYFEKNGELYIVFDEVEFFGKKEAKKEYFKDGNTEEPMEEWGNDYYIRNNDNSTKVYKVNKDSKIELLSFEVGKNDSIELVPSTVDNLKKKIDKYKKDKDLQAGLLFNIDENDDIVYGMRSIYTP